MCPLLILSLIGSIYLLAFFTASASYRVKEHVALCGILVDFLMPWARALIAVPRVPEPARAERPSSLV